SARWTLERLGGQRPAPAAVQKASPWTPWGAVTGSSRDDEGAWQPERLPDGRGIVVSIADQQPHAVRMENRPRNDRDHWTVVVPLTQAGQERLRAVASTHPGALVGLFVNG